MSACKAHQWVCVWGCYSAEYGAQRGGEETAGASAVWSEEYFFGGEAPTPGCQGERRGSHCQGKNIVRTSFFPSGFSTNSVTYHTGLSFSKYYTTDALTGVVGKMIVILFLKRWYSGKK